MARRFGKVGKSNVFLMDKTTKAIGKRGIVAVLSLKTGDVAIVKRSKIKGITTKFPKK